jgi:hypothetical protein
MELIERPPHVRPAESERHRGVRAIPGQPLEPGIAVDLKHATEGAQVGGGADVLAVLCIDIGRDRMARSAPGPVIHRVAPQPSGLGLPAPRIEHRQGGIIGKQFRR